MIVRQPMAIKQKASGNSLAAALHAAETASGSHATTQAFIKCAQLFLFLYWYYSRLSIEYC